MGALDELVSECRRVEADGGTIGDVESIYGALQTVVPDARRGLAMFRQTINGRPPYTPEDVRRDARTMRMKAELYRERLEREERARLAEAEASRTSVTATATATASVEVDVSAAIDAIGTMGQEDRDAAELALGRAQRAAKAGDKREFADRVLELVKVGAKYAEALPLVAKAVGALAAGLT